MMSPMQAYRWGLIVGMLAGTVIGAAQGTGEFVLKVLTLKGLMEVVTNEGARPVKSDATIVPGAAVRVSPRGVAVLLWMPYKARLKVEGNGQVRLLPTRVLQVEAGRVWIGTPHPPPGERRYPLPVRVGPAQLVSSPDARFSVDVSADKRILLSVDEGTVFISVGKGIIVVGKGQMIFLLPNGVLRGPMPMSREEQMRWDAGGAH